MPNRRSILTAGFFVAFLHLHFNINAADTALFLQSDSAKFANYLRKATAGLDSAEYYFDKAESYANTSSLEIRLNRMRGWYLFDLAEYDSAISHVKSILLVEHRGTVSDYLELGGCHYLLRTLYLAKNDFHSAVKEGHLFIEKYEKANGQGIDVFASGLVNLAIDYWRIKKFNKALEILKEVEKNLELYPAQDMLISAYITYGLIYEDLNDLPLALEFYKYVFKLIGTNPTDNLRNYTITCNNLAIVYTQMQHYDSALKYYNKALVNLESRDIEERHKYLIPYYLSDVLGNMGNVYFQKNEFSKAISFHEKAIGIQMGDQERYHPNLSVSYGTLAKTYMKIGDLEKASAALEKNRFITEKYDIDLSRTQNLYGNLKMKLGFYEEAEVYYDSAIANQGIVVLDGSKIYDHPEVVIASFMGKAKAASQLGKDPEEILEQYLNTKKLIEFLYSKTNDLTIFNSIGTTLDSYFSEFDRLYGETSDDSWFSLMWEIAELNKAANLKKQLRNNYSLSYSIPKEMHFELQSVRDSINLVLSENQPGQIDSVLFHLNKRLKELTTLLEKEYPDYHSLKTTINVRDYKRLQSELTDREMILNFYEGEDQIHIIKVSKNSTESKDVESDLLAPLITSFGEAVQRNESSRMDSLSNLLRFEIGLNSEFFSDFDHLTILPDGVVWELNFAALSDEDQTDYLGNDITVNYKYYTDLPRNQLKKNNSKVLAFSLNEETDSWTKSSYSTFRDLDGSLPGTSKEVSSISKIWDGDYYFSAAASESKFKELSNGYGILHLAVHGLQDEHFPENSFLKFASEDSMNDGKLHAYELYGLTLNSELAVLSACHSGDGKIVKGEGMRSIAQAFSYAGVSSVLGSRWLVPDISAPHIMKYFYEGLKMGLRKSESLKYAQNQYLQNDADNITSAPFYWAGFYVIGEDGPISSDQSNLKWWLGILIIPIVLFFFLRRKRLN